TRANIADLQIDLEGEAPHESTAASEPDPIDETPRVPASAPVEAPGKRMSSSIGDPSTGASDAESDADEKLFGMDIFEKLQAAQVVKLDPTVDLPKRLATLPEVGYLMVTVRDHEGARRFDSAELSAGQQLPATLCFCGDPTAP
ncbi:MAG: hypothetical protein JF606_29780, partial [Burkholderiales bacterium]|nr:hypothetical protein [Burkholderiales bacterium]